MNFLSLLVLTVFFMFGCVVDQGKVSVDIKRKNLKASSTLSASVSNVQIVNNKLVITGTGLNTVSNVVVDGNTLNQNFAIESQTATQIIANAVSAFSFDVSKVFNLILSDANAATTFQIDFDLCHAILSGQGFDCNAAVADKDVLSFDQNSGKWIPRSINGLTYRGVWNANNAQPAGALAGDYYIVSVANMPTYGVGDWIVWNGGSYQKINNTTTITSVFGRNGAIVATKGDYDLNMLTDVDLTLPLTAGKVLKYNGSKWVADDDLSGGGAGSVTSAEIVAGAVTDSKIDTVSASKIIGTLTSTQIADGTIVNADISATAAIDYSKLNIPAGSIPYAKLNIGAGDIPADRISGLPAATSILTTSITNGDLTHAPDGNSIFDALVTKLNTTGGVLSIGTISGVPTPTNNDDVANKVYVDTKIAKTAIPTCGAGEVLKADGSAFTCVTDNTGAGAFSGAANRAVATNGAGALIVSTTTDTELGYVSGVTSSIQTQLNAKQTTIPATTSVDYYRGDKTFATLNTTAVPEGTALYFTEPRVLAAVLTSLNTGVNGPITAVDSILGAFGKLQYQITDLKTFDTNVQTFAKTALPTCGVGEVLKSNGSAFSCVTDASGAGAFTGTLNRAMATDGAGALIVSATTATELGYVSGVTSSIQTQLDSKQGTITAGTSAQYYRGDKTFVTLDTAIVPENTNLYFTTARAKSATVADAIANGVLDVAPSQNAVFDALALKISTTGGTLTVGTINGVPNPTNNDDVANKAYVDTAVSGFNSFTEAQVLGTDLLGLNTGVNGPIVAADTVLGAMGKLQYQVTDLKSFGQWTKSSSDLVYSVGNVQIDNNLKLKDSGTNFVQIKAPATVTSTYTLTMPPTAGTANYVLQTNGAGGVLSWVPLTDSSVQAFAKAALPTCNAGEVLKSNGTTFSCVTDNSGAAAFSGSVNRAIASDGSGALAVSATTATELGYVSGVTSSIQTQLNSKEATITAGTSSQYLKGDKTLGTFTSDVLGTLTTGLSTATSAVIAATDSILISLGKLQAQISGQSTTLSGKADTTNVAQTITAASVTGLTLPMAGSDAANKTYVDSQISGNGVWTNGAGAYAGSVYRASGNVGIGTTEPITILHVVAPNAVEAARFERNSSGTTGLSGIARLIRTSSGTTTNGFGGGLYFGLQKPDGTTMISTGSVSSVMDDGTSGTESYSLRFGTNSAGTISEKMVINAIGNVGIGTTAPEARAHINYGNTPVNAAETLRLEVTGNTSTDRGPFLSFYSPNGSGTSKESAHIAGVQSVTDGGGSLLFKTSSPGSAVVPSERMRINSSGNVGIGTTTPATALEVNGTITKNGSVSKTSAYAVPTATNVTINLPNGGTTLVDGYVYKFNLATQGTGTVTGASYIVYQTAVGTWATKLVSSNGNTSNHPLLQISGTNVQIYHNHASSYNLGVLAEAIQTGNVTAVSPNYFGLDGAITNNAGNVGIGVTVPMAKLDVGNSGVGVPATTGTSDSNSALRIGYNLTSWAGGQLDFGTYNSPQSYASWMQARNPADYSISRNLILQPTGGNIGVGASYPSSKLSISGSSLASGAAQSNISAFANNGIRFDGSVSNISQDAITYQSGGGGGAAISFRRDASYGTFLDFYTNNSATPGAVTRAMTIDSLGYLGIGTSTPTTLLDVNGTAKINVLQGGQLNGSGNFHLEAHSSGAQRAVYINWYTGTGGLAVGNGAAGYGPIAASSFNINSDRRLKKNIQEITGALDIIDQLKGVRFDWISTNEYKDRQIGVIAQDVQKVLPELVTLNKENNRLSVNYSGLVAPLIEAVKELYHKWFDDSASIHREIASAKEESKKDLGNLKSDNLELKKTNEKLKNENEMIKKYLCGKDKNAPFCH